MWRGPICIFGFGPWFGVSRVRSVFRDSHGKGVSDIIASTSSSVGIS